MIFPRQRYGSFYSSTLPKEVHFEFYKVCKDLLHEFNLDRYRDLLKLVRIIWNSFHNNGVHISNDDEVSWREMTFHFKKGQNVELGHVRHTFTIIPTDILDILKELVKSDAILQKQEIIDISYNNLF